MSAAFFTLKYLSQQKNTRTTLASLRSHILDAAVGPNEMKSELKTGHPRHLEACFKVTPDIFISTFTLPTKLHPFMGRNF